MTSLSGAIQQALAAAISAAAQVRGTTSPNPPVGAVILDVDGHIVGVGGTQPAGGAHAEVQALNQAGPRARGGTAVTTLEPCNHTGRTGPCSHALYEAGVTQLYYVHPDPTGQASGGAEYLRQQGVRVEQILDRVGPVADLVPWLRATELGRPHVTLKFAQTLDGFTAARDGSSQWITGDIARDHVHQDRRRRDAIIIGTGTALADNPSLTARDEVGEPYPEQPRRVVIGTRDIDAGASPNLHRLGFAHYPDISGALEELWEQGARDVLVEGGASLAEGFLKAGLVDAVQAYIAPKLLGEGRGVLAGPVAQTLSDAAEFELQQVTRLAGDVLLELKSKGSVKS